LLTNIFKHFPLNKSIFILKSDGGEIMGKKTKCDIQMLNGNQGQMGIAQGIVLGLVVLGVLASIGANVVSTTRDTMTTNSAEYNVADKSISGLTKFSNMMPLIGIVGGAVIVISLVYLLRTRE